MVVKFRGVRGSAATPLTPVDFGLRIFEIINRIEPSDLESESTKARFFDNLPLFLRSTVGCNTSCVEMRLSNNTILIFDCGTGLRNIDREISQTGEKITEFHIFLSHFHYDHISGIPFFSPLFNPGVTVHFYSPYANMENILKKYMRKPYFPVPFDVFGATIEFHVLSRNYVLKIGEAEVTWIERSHPDGTAAYKVCEGGKSFIYSTDTELRPEDFEQTKVNKAFFKDVDSIVLDSQYNLKESFDKRDWGHSSFTMAIDFAEAFGIKRLFMFHHEPRCLDDDLLEVFFCAQGYLKAIEKDKKEEEDFMEIQLAIEGREYEI